MRLEGEAITSDEFEALLEAEVVSKQQQKQRKKKRHKKAEQKIVADDDADHMSNNTIDIQTMQTLLCIIKSY